MNTCKKIVTLLLALSLMLGCFAANAATMKELAAGTKTGTTSVVLDLGVGTTSYTIRIPSEVTIDKTTKEASFTIAILNPVLADIPFVKVRLTDGYTDVDVENQEQAYMTLKNEKNGLTLDFNLDIPNSHSPSTSDPNYVSLKTYDLLKVTAADNGSSYTSGSVNLSYKAPVGGSSFPTFGEYTGTLTFSVITSENE